VTRRILVVDDNPKITEVLAAYLEADGFEVSTHPNDLHAVSVALAKRLAVGGSRVTFIPKETVRIADADKARSMLKLMNALEDLDDVQNVHANFEIEDKLMEQMA